MSQVYYSPSPLSAYNQTANKIHSLLNEISAELSKQTSVDAPPRVIHWGHVGDLNEINHKLEQVLRFIRNEG